MPIAEPPGASGPSDALHEGQSPLHVFVADPPPALIRQLIDLANAHRGLTIEVVDSPAAVIDRRMAGRAVLIAWYAAIERLHQSDPATARAVTATVPVIIAFNWEKALAVERLAVLAAGWLVVENTQHLGIELLELSLEELWILPALLKQAAPAKKLESLILAQLTTAEKRVLAHLARGDSDRSIAKLMHVTEATEKRLLRSALRKLDAPSRVQAASFSSACYSNGLLQLE